MVYCKEPNVSSHPILPDSRRAAIEAVLDETLAEVRAAGDVALLHECRGIFRKKVPLSLRAYVAAAFALRLASTGAPSDQQRGKRHDEPRREPRGTEKHGREQAAGPAPRSQTAKKPAESARPAKPAAERNEASERREPEIRENRYRGEGVTLFVSAGRRQRFYARVAIAKLLETPGVGSEQIGDIRTMDNYSFIVVDPAVEDTVLAALNGYDFKGRVLAANRARKRGEPAPAQQGDETPRPASTSVEGASGSGAGYGSDDEESYREEDESFDDSDLDEFGSGSGEPEPEADPGDETTEGS
jgi:hypothetical protein